MHERACGSTAGSSLLLGRRDVAFLLVFWCGFLLSGSGGTMKNISSVVIEGKGFTNRDFEIVLNQRLAFTMLADFSNTLSLDPTAQ